jgi:hypothetical protein
LRRYEWLNRDSGYGAEVDLDTEVVLDNQGDRLTEERAAEITDSATRVNPSHADPSPTTCG